MKESPRDQVELPSSSDHFRERDGIFFGKEPFLLSSDSNQLEQILPCLRSSFASSAILNTSIHNGKGSILLRSESSTGLGAPSAHQLTWP